jgi:hypothetical protein
VCGVVHGIKDINYQIAEFAEAFNSIKLLTFEDETWLVANSWTSSLVQSSDG